MRRAVWKRGAGVVAGVIVCGCMGMPGDVLDPARSVAEPEDPTRSAIAPPLPLPELPDEAVVPEATGAAYAAERVERWRVRSTREEVLLDVGRPGAGLIQRDVVFNERVVSIRTDAVDDQGAHQTLTLLSVSRAGEILRTGGGPPEPYDDLPDPALVASRPAASLIRPTSRVGAVVPITPDGPVANATWRVAAQLLDPGAPDRGHMRWWLATNWTVGVRWTGPDTFTFEDVRRDVGGDVVAVEARIVGGGRVRRTPDGRLVGVVVDSSITPARVEPRGRYSGTEIVWRQEARWLGDGEE